jgi:hypothetical protein
MKRITAVGRAAVAFLAIVSLACCSNVFMNGIKSKVAADTAKSLGIFGFAASNNAQLYCDVAGTVSGTNISVTVPKWVPLTNLVATFQFQGKSITVNGAAQTSGTTTNNFSSPVVYTVTPASGASVKYIVTVINGSQGLMGGVIQGTPLNLSGTVTTIAGTASPFGNPRSSVRVGSYLYVVDSRFAVIWQVNVTSGVYSVFAGSLAQRGYQDGTGTGALFFSPMGIATDGTTNLYVCDMYNQRIRQITLVGAVVSTIAGSGEKGSTDGSGTAASFNYPTGLYYDPNTDLLFETDQDGKTVRTISITSPYTVTTIVSTGLTTPQSLTISKVGTAYDLFVVDSGNTTTPVPAAIYQFTLWSGYPSTKAPSSITSTKITLNSTSFIGPQGIAVFDNYLFVSDSSCHSIIAVNPSSGSGTVWAGSGSSLNTGRGHVDGVNGQSIQFYSPNDVYVNSGTMYVAEGGNQDIRVLTSLDAVNNTGIKSSTLAGVWPDCTNGNGSAARFCRPRHLTCNGQTVWIADDNNDLVRSMGLTNSYTVSLVAGNQIAQAAEQDGTGSGAVFDSPLGITTDGKCLYICDTNGNVIRRINIASGAVDTIAGSATNAGLKDGQGTSAWFNQPRGITTDGTNLYVADSLNNAVRMISLSNFTVSTIVNSGVGNPSGITTDGSSLYVACTSNGSIKKISLSSAPNYSVTPVAGGSIGYANGTGAAAEFDDPAGITTDGTNLYVCDNANNAIRQIVIATGVVTTLAGNNGLLMAGQPITYGESDGQGTEASFNYPNGIATDGTYLYATDEDNNTIRIIK